jgi:hypothetical protein
MRKNRKETIMHIDFHNGDPAEALNLGRRLTLIYGADNELLQLVADQTAAIMFPFEHHHPNRHASLVTQFLSNEAPEVIITHSEAVLDHVQKLVEKGSLAPEDVGINVICIGGYIVPIFLDERGDTKNVWPAEAALNQWRWLQ